MKILVSGGCGFVGSNLCIYLKKKLKKVKIYSVDNLFRKGSEINKKRLKNFYISLFEEDVQKNGAKSLDPSVKKILEKDREIAIEKKKIIKFFEELH